MRSARHLAAALLAVGLLLTPAVARLRDSGRFHTAELVRRYRSLTRRDRIALIITVHERVGIGRKLLLLPEIHYNEDEKFSIGGRVNANDVFGAGEFISVPVLFGGLDRVALEVRKDWDSGWSVGGEFGARRVRNPHFKVDDERVRGAAFVQFRVADPLWLLLQGTWDDVTFGELSQRLSVYGVSFRFDTRLDPAFAYDSILLTGSWEVLRPQGDATVNRFRLELAGHKTLIGQAVLAVRGYASFADRPLPEYERAVIGGMVSLRGYRAGSFSGDNSVLGTVELRLPITAVRSVGRVGLTAFWDVGTAHDDGTRLDGAVFHHGVGGGVFLVAPIVRLNVDVGTDLKGSTRLHFVLGFRF